jgi:hypothetical protein
MTRKLAVAASPVGWQPGSVLQRKPAKSSLVPKKTFFSECYVLKERPMALWRIIAIKRWRNHFAQEAYPPATTDAEQRNRLRHIDFGLTPHPTAAAYRTMNDRV